MTNNSRRRLELMGEFEINRLQPWQGAGEYWVLRVLTHVAQCYCVQVGGELWVELLPSPAEEGGPVWGVAPQLFICPHARQQDCAAGSSGREPQRTTWNTTAAASVQVVCAVYKIIAFQTGGSGGEKFQKIYDENKF